MSDFGCPCRICRECRRRHPENWRITGLICSFRMGRYVFWRTARPGVNYP